MEDVTSSGYHRPRRPASDTIAYLRGLPLDIDVAHTEVTRYVHDEKDDEGSNDDDDFDFPQNLAAAFTALFEIKNEIASLAGDEYGSQSIETIARIVCPYSELASRILLNTCTGYYLHLVTHRYGSHVIQTILQLSVESSSTLLSSSYNDTDLALHKDAASPLDDIASSSLLPTLHDLIIGIVDELSPHISDLTVHLCGSHVVRTLMCVLGGVTLEAGFRNNSNANKRFETGATIRGKLKKKKKKKKKPSSASDDPSGTNSHAGTMSMIYQENSRIDCKRFMPTLASLTQLLLGGEHSVDEPGELQQHACHSSAGPLLIVLIRVLTCSTDVARCDFSKSLTVPSSSKSLDADAAISHASNTAIADFRLGILKSEPRYTEGSLADKAVKRILCWQNDSSPDSDQQYVGDVIYGLSGEPRGSHMLETIMRLCPDEFYDSVLKYGDFLSVRTMQDYVEHNVSNFVVQTLLSTTRSKEQAETVLKTVGKAISSGSVIDPSKKRRGVLWRATELSAKYRIEQDGILKAVRLGFLAINGDSNNNIEINSNPEADNLNNNDSGDSTAERGTKKKQRKKASAIELKDCVPLLIGLKRDQNERITLDVAGCRTIHYMLRFAPRLCEQVLEGIIEEISAEDLISIAKDGLGSRCIMDGILDGPVKTPIFANAAKELREKLNGHWISLATDRVGHHTVKKIFKALPRIDDKAKLTEELLSGGNRLNGNSMGRNVIELCLVDLYDEDRKEWRNKVGRMMTSTKEDDFLSEIIAEHTAVSNVEGETAVVTTKTKRKRKRKRSTNSIDDSNADAGKDSKKTQQKSSSNMTMESIMDVMAVGN